MMEASAEGRSTDHLGRLANSTKDTYPPVSLNPAPFSRHRAAPRPSRSTSGAALRNSVPLQRPLPNHRFSSDNRSLNLSPVTSAHDVAAAVSSASLYDTSRLPLDLLESEAARWASTAGRGGRRVPRVRSTLGPQSEVVDTGVFVCPDTVVDALYSAAPGRSHVVVTAESGGWLRVREQQTGTIRYQQRLRDGGEATCLAWASAAGDTSTDPPCTIVVVGHLSGLISFYFLVGESLVELSSATCVFHEAPVLSCLQLCAPVSAGGRAVMLSGACVSTLLSLDADGVVALWSLQVASTDQGPRCGRATEAVLSSVLLDSLYASLKPSAPFVSLRGTEGAAEVPPPPPPSLPVPPVVVSAAFFSCSSTSPPCVLSTYRFVHEPPSSIAADSDGRAANTQGDAVVYLSSVVAYGAGLKTAGVPMNRGASTHLGEGHALMAGGSPFRSHVEWEVLRVYRIPVTLSAWRGGRAGAASADTVHVAVTALCVTECHSRNNGLAAAEQLWAGTSDGRLLIWQARTAQFLRCLHSASAAPVHSLTSLLSSGSPGHALVWASQADGSVVAWSADTYTVAEVLPVSYPPPGPVIGGGAGNVEGSTGGVNPGEVVTVRDAVDLLRATRHCSVPSTSPAQWRRNSGFTLFLKPMALVCMQRAWSVATDGTVRTWLLPAGEASAVGAVADTSTGFSPQSPRNGADSTACAPSLDVGTIQCFLQDRADEWVRERRMHRVELDAMQEQLCHLQERNRVLTTALQQATHRLERVTVDMLVRPGSPAGSPLSASSSEEEAGTGAAVVGSVAVSSDPLATAPRTTSCDASDAEGQLTMEAQPPITDANPYTGLLPLPHPGNLPSEAQAHVQVLQQLLEELHAKLEESWSRNDALREELLMYQLRTLDCGEDTVRPMRMAETTDGAVATIEIGDTEGQATATPGVAATATSISAPSLLPSPHSMLDRLCLGTPGHDKGANCGEHGRHLRIPSPPQIHRFAKATDTASMFSTPFPALHSPSVLELVHSRAAKSRSLTPPQPLKTASAKQIAGTSSAEVHVIPSPIIEASLGSSTAAERFLTAASAMLHTSTRTVAGSTIQGGCIAGGTHVRSPLLQEVEVEEENCIEEDDVKGPSLVEAWCTSEGDLSPIHRRPRDPESTGGFVPSTDVFATRGGWRVPLFSSLISSSLISSRSSLKLTEGGDDDEGSGGSSRIDASTDAVPSTRVAAIWTTPERAEGRGWLVSRDASARARVAASCRSGLRPASGALAPSAVPPAPAPASTAVGVVPVRHADTISAATSPPNTFRSPIIYHSV